MNPQTLLDNLNDPCTDFEVFIEDCEDLLEHLQKGGEKPDGVIEDIALDYALGLGCARIARAINRYLKED